MLIDIIKSCLIKVKKEIVFVGIVFVGIEKRLGE